MLTRGGYGVGDTVTHTSVRSATESEVFAWLSSPAK